MGCGSCGGVRPQPVRKQNIEQSRPSTQPIQRRIGQAAQPASVQRQYLVNRSQCVKCGFPMMLVHMSGRERQQCSNANCRIIND